MGTLWGLKHCILYYVNKKKGNGYHTVFIRRGIDSKNLVLGDVFVIPFFSCLISPKRKKLDSCSWAQKKRLEILFPAAIKLLSFHCRFSVFLLPTKCTRIFYWTETTGYVQSAELEKSFPTVIYFLRFAFENWENDQIQNFPFFLS
jgi:hypothetical protein